MDVAERLTRHVANEEAARIIALIEDGRSQRYVAGVIGVQQCTIPRVVYSYQEIGQLSKRAVQGRRMVTSVLDDRYLRLTGLRIRHTTARRLQVDLLAARNVRLVLQIVRNMFREACLRL